MKKQSTATVTRSIALRRAIGHLAVDRHGAAAATASRVRTALARLWRETVVAHERMLARPWEAEGALRWQRDAGGVKLIGSSLRLRENDVSAEPDP